MILNAKKLALAAAITMGIAYVVCTVFTAIAPEIALKFLGWMLHLVDAEKFADGTEITIGTFFLGLLPLLIYTYLGTWVLAALYNRFLRKDER